MGKSGRLLLGARLLVSTVRSLAGIVVPIYLALSGFSALELGVLFVVVGLTSALFSITVAAFVNKLGCKFFLILFPILLALAAGGFAVTTLPPLLFIFAAIGTFGRGAGAGAGAVGPYQPAEQTYITQLVAPTLRNQVFGLFGSASALGGVLGGLLALFFRATPHTAVLSFFRPGFIVIATVSFTAGLLAVFIVGHKDASLIQDIGDSTGPTSTGPTSTGPANLPSKTRPPVRYSSDGLFSLSKSARSLTLKLFFTNAVNGVAIGMFAPFLSYWLYLRFHANPAEIGILFVFINLISVVSTLSAANIANRFGLLRAIVMTRIVQSVLLIPFAFSPNLLIAGLILGCRMLVQRIGMPLRQSYVMGVLNPDERARVSALSNLGSQLMMTLSPLLSGEILAEMALSLPFGIAGVVQLINAVMFYIFFHKILPEDERQEVSEQEERYTLDYP
ncbi:MAG: MFS transporter [Actinobacteria bacterium]|jgi:MFS family permease|nr:MFS transporter [Actinomycetota bacterium]